MTRGLSVLRADPAGNVTLLVTDAVAPALRAPMAVALLQKYGGEQVGFLTPPRRGGDTRLEMMGGEFCGNAARCAGYWYGVQRGRSRVLVEVSGCDAPLAVLADRERQTAEAQMPLPVYMGREGETPVAVLPGIAHALCGERGPSETHARALTRRLTARFDVPAAGVLYWDRATLFLRPAVYVRGTDTLYFESSCASGSAAAAALLSAERPEGETCLDLKQPGGVIRARALRQGGELRTLAIGGRLTLGEPFSAEIEI